jgi:hypothetical protein
MIGTYRTPKVRIGQIVRCEVRGLLKVAKRQAGERLLNVLVGLWKSSDARAYHYRNCLFFAQPGVGGAWRLAAR